MNNRHHRWLAALLALLGQVTLTFGLPLPAAPHRPGVVGNPEALSPCGCNADERAAGKCCCARPKTPTPCCAAEEAPPEPVAPCCAQHKPEPKPARQPAGVRWVGGVLLQKCLTTAAAAFGAAVPACVPPGRSASWCFDWSPRGWTFSDAYRPSAVPSLPLTPPPR